MENDDCTMSGPAYRIKPDAFVESAVRVHGALSESQEKQLDSDGQRKPMTDLVVCPPHTVDITHIFDGEEVVTGGDSGQIWIATFSDRVAAEWFVKFAQEQGIALRGERAANKPEPRNLEVARKLKTPTLYDAERPDAIQDTPDFRRFCAGCRFEHGPDYADCFWLKDIG